MKIQKRLRYGSNSIITSHKNLGRLASFFKISLVGFHITCIPNLSFLNKLEVAQKFDWWRFQRLYGEVPEIIWCAK